MCHCATEPISTVHTSTESPRALLLLLLLQPSEDGHTPGYSRVSRVARLTPCERRPSNPLQLLLRLDLGPDILADLTANARVIEATVSAYRCLHSKFEAKPLFNSPVARLLVTTLSAAHAICAQERPNARLGESRPDGKVRTASRMHARTSRAARAAQKSRGFMRAQLASA